MGKIIGVLSIKGGAGKTSTVVSLGAALASFGKKVLLVDANFSAPNLGIHLNVLEPEKTIHDALSGKNLINEVVVELDDFDIIPASVFPGSQIKPLDLKNRLRILKPKYDFILVDSSPALNEETLAAINASDELFVVSTPDYSTLTMTLKAIKLAKKQGTSINGLILNKVHGRNFELTLEEIERTSDVPVMAVIPHEVSVLKSQSHFVPHVNYKPRSRGSVEYLKLASCLAGEKYSPSKLSKFFNKFSPKKQEINRDIFYQAVF